jgi:transcription termination factor Rho
MAKKKNNSGKEIKNNYENYEKEVLKELENDEFLNQKLLQEKSVKELQVIAKEIAIENFLSYKKHELVQKIIDTRLKQKGSKFYLGGGILQIQGQASFGFLRNVKENFIPSNDDIYVSPQNVRKYLLRMQLQEEHYLKI